MAKKPFEIQGSTLRIAGVDLEAGRTSIVIPGITQATTYSVDEVDDSGDQEITFNEVPVVIDIVIFNDYVANGSTAMRAEYLAELEDDGYIDEIEVNYGGVYLVQDYNDMLGANPLLAYTGTAVDPFSPFVEEDWTSIPFRVRMRAGEVENVGGGTGGGVVERSVQFPMGETGDTRGTIALTPDDTTYICTADYENLTPQYQGNYSVVNSEAYDINQSGGESNMITVDATGNTDLLFIIANGSYANSDWTIDAGVAYGGVQTCNSVGTNGNLIYFSWPHRTGVDPTTIAQGDPATVTYNGTITQQPIWTKLISGVDNGGDGEISWSSEGDLTIETLRPQDYDGDCDLNLYAADDVFITANGDDVSITAFNVVRINSDDGNHTWTFDNNGILTLPGANTYTIGEDEPGLAIRSGAGFAVLTNVISNTYEVEFIGFVSNGFGDSPGATLTVTEIVAGTITDGMTIYGDGLPPEGWVVTFGGGVMEPQGTGDVGNYLLSGANILTSSQSFNNGVTAEGSNAWVFESNGGITFPDATVQTTAYPGVLVPANSTGVAGDREGMIAVGGGYLYVCTANWASPGTADIWTRTLLTTGAW